MVRGITAGRRVAASLNLGVGKQLLHFGGFGVSARDDTETHRAPPRFTENGGE